MTLFGLIGYPLGHSFSQRYFTEKFVREGIADTGYALFPMVDVGALREVLRQNPTLHGLNVTIPHKQAVIPFLDNLDETARAVGAVNCIAIRDGRLTGYNTDVIGFEISLRNFLIKNKLAFSSVSNALILGTGGAAKAVAFVLQKCGVPYHFVSRQPVNATQVSYADVQLGVGLTPSTLIVNATPTGTYPNVLEYPELPYAKLGPANLVFDLVYNPPQTLLLQKALAQGCPTQNGLEMLEEQAEAAWECWNV